MPQDIEWSIAGDKLYLLPSLPITTLTEQDPFAGRRNATYEGDYPWTNMSITVEQRPESYRRVAALGLA